MIELYHADMSGKSLKKKNQTVSSVFKGPKGYQGPAGLPGEQVSDGVW